MHAADPKPPSLERISVELTGRCDKACWFCYNHSGPAGADLWQVDDLVELLADCAANGVRAVSFGGGEPLQFEGLGEVLAATRCLLFRSMTTNGLLLDNARIAAIRNAGIDKVHVSIHFPEREEEIVRALDCLERLDRAGIRSGINLLVAKSKLEPATAAARRLKGAGIDAARIVYLPMRIHDEPSPNEVAAAAGGPFQSMTCLMACAKSPRFASIDAQARAAWCSYTTSRRKLSAPTHAALIEALEGLDLMYCGGGTSNG